jgi:hypothetical protein
MAVEVQFLSDGEPAPGVPDVLDAANQVADPGATPRRSGRRAAIVGDQEIDLIGVKGLLAFRSAGLACQSSPLATKIATSTRSAGAVSIG